MALSRIFVAPKNGQGGVKKSKKIYFFKKNIRKMGKKNFGTSGTILKKKIDFLKLWSQRSQNLFFPSFEYTFWKNKFFLIFWPLLDHFLVQQKFLITPFLAPGQFTTENRAIFGPYQQFFLRQKFDRKGVKNHQNIFGECSLGSKEHLKFWSFLTPSEMRPDPPPPYPTPTPPTRRTVPRSRP